MIFGVLNPEETWHQ